MKVFSEDIKKSVKLAEVFVRKIDEKLVDDHDSSVWCELNLNDYIYDINAIEPILFDDSSFGDKELSAAIGGATFLAQSSLNEDIISPKNSDDPERLARNMVESNQQEYNSVHEMKPLKSQQTVSLVNVNSDSNVKDLKKLTLCPKNHSSFNQLAVSTEFRHLRI